MSMARTSSCGTNPPAISMTDVPADIMAKMERFCAMQEHLSESQEDAVVKSLRENRYLDEERYVELFVRSKVKSAWGRQKIVAALRAKGIPSELIAAGCEEISDDDYTDRLRNAIGKWRRSHPDEAPNSPKLVRHLMSKGYGIGEVMRELAVSSCDGSNDEE